MIEGDIDNKKSRRKAPYIPTAKAGVFTALVGKKKTNLFTGW